MALFPKLEASEYQLLVLNEFLRTTSEQTIRLDRFTTLRTTVPQGHTIKLTRMSEQDANVWLIDCYCGPIWLARWS